MGAYRIGRIQQPWINFTPPIRGGVYRKYQDEEESIGSSSDEDEPGLTSDLASSDSSVTSVDLSADEDCEGTDALLPAITKINSRDDDGRVGGTDADIKYRRAYEATVDIVDPRGERKAPTTRLLPHLPSPEAYTATTVQSEIDRDLRNYPPLDEKTQRDITLKYQALHQRVKDEGFYDCHYIEYGKEFVRYAILFALFFVSLKAEWYMTSAAFLGLFW
ncbi:hypothetical protein MMC19_005193, partial [Ptychographa xylographoides]|nr:hypothetical protein [Ptychographa xylographoides]